MALLEESKGKHTVRFMCPVPYEFCKGEKDDKTRLRCHSSAEALRSCQTMYLVKQGYKKIGSRQFETPEGSILILSKKPVRIKGGKGDRIMRRDKTGQVISW